MSTPRIKIHYVTNIASLFTACGKTPKRVETIGRYCRVTCIDCLQTVLRTREAQRSRFQMTTDKLKERLNQLSRGEE